MRITDKRQAKLVAYLAGQQGVTPEHFIAVVRARQAHRARKYHLKRSRKRSLEKNLKAYKRKPQVGNIYSGESEFSALLRVVGLKRIDFIRMTGINEEMFTRWYGNPMHPWPIELLRWYGYAKAMEKYLMERGVDPQIFKPKLPTLLIKQGRYPRRKGQEPTLAPGVGYSPWKPQV